MKYVIISDTHLGQDGRDDSGQCSLLSGHLDHPQGKIRELAQLIEGFKDGDPITLIGLGDILDMSLSDFRTALWNLLVLFNRLPSFDNFIYIPGNHDHHIWTLHTEYKNVFKRLEDGILPKPGSIYGEIEKLERFKLLENVLATPTCIAYPYYNIPSTNIYLTHGHLFGGIYTLLSDILSPIVEVESIATANMPLTESIYWLLAQMGKELGANGIIETIYSDTQKGKKSLLYKVLKQTIETIMPNGVIKGIPDGWEKKFVNYLGRQLINKYVKHPKTLSNFDRFAAETINRAQAVQWAKKNIETDSYTLVSGHTHRMDFYTDKENTIINLGSWLIEVNDPEPQSGILLIDSDNKLELRKI